MNKHAILHRAKSEFAYAYNTKTIHITLRTAKNDVSKVNLIYGDPFEWKKNGWVHKVESMIKRYETKLFDYYFISITLKDLRVKYAFLIESGNNKYLYGSKKLIENYKDDEVLLLNNYFNYPYINPEDLHETPNWVKDTIWYQIFPDRFYTLNPMLPFNTYPVNNNQIFGGNLKGIKSKIPYLKELGISGIYFTPIFEAKTAHKYDTINYFKIDPSFGTNEDFKDLVDECHKNGIKIMLDGVFNHSGFRHPFFLDIVEKGEKSIYKNSFYIDKFPVINFPIKDGFPYLYDENGKQLHNAKEPLNFKTFAYTPHMPKWNTNDEFASKHLLDVITYWLKEYNIDGWRLDVSNEVSHDFLRDIKKASRKANPNSFILGENWDQSLPWLLGDQLDSVMNYDLSYPIWEYLEHKINLEDFKDIVNTYLALTPKNVMANMFNLIDSHDTVRILRRLDDNIDRVKIAYLLMFLSKGAPNIYYGGEIGLTGNHDPDNRRPMIWDKDKQNLDLFNFIKTLIKLREKYEAFKTSDYYFLNENILAFNKGNNKELLVLINNSNNSVTININGHYLNLLTNITSSYDKITLKGYEFKLLLKI